MKHDNIAFKASLLRIAEKALEDIRGLCVSSTYWNNPDYPNCARLLKQHHKIVSDAKVKAEEMTAYRGEDMIGDNGYGTEESIHKHTPGPWTIYNYAGTNSGHYDGYLKSDIRAGADLIHIRQSVAGNTFPRLAANVRLIAAAPSMYDALWAIANMQVQEETDKGEVLALCMSIARIELEKCSTAGK